MSKISGSNVKSRLSRGFGDGGSDVGGVSIVTLVATDSLSDRSGEDRIGGSSISTASLMVSMGVSVWLYVRIGITSRRSRRPSFKPVGARMESVILGSGTSM